MVVVVVVEISGDGNGEMINRDLLGGDGSDEHISVVDGGMKLGGCGQVNSEVVVIGTLSRPVLSRPCDSAEPHTPIEAFPQSSRPLPVPLPHCSLFCSVERGAFLLIVTMFPFCLRLLFPSVLLCYPLPLFLL